MSKEIDKASEIVRNAAGRRPDFPSGKDYVDEVRGHISEQDIIREGMALLIPTDCGNCYLDGNREIRSDCDDLEEPGSPCLLQLFLVKEYFSYLHSQGLRLPNGEALIDETND